MSKTEQLKPGDPCQCGDSRLYAFNYTDSHGRDRRELLCAACKMPHWDNYKELIAKEESK